MKVTIHNNTVLDDDLDNQHMQENAETEELTVQLGTDRFITIHAEELEVLYRMGSASKIPAIRKAFGLPAIVVVFGNPMIGFTVHGPFADEDDAERFVNHRSHDDVHGWIIEVEE